MVSGLLSGSPELDGRTQLEESVSEFAKHVHEGLSPLTGKYLSPRYLYDDLGSALFEAITVLPEYGLTRADERLLSRHAYAISSLCGPLDAVVELGSGSGKKATYVLRGSVEQNPGVSYYPIDVSSAALTACEREIGTLCTVRPIVGDWMTGLAEVASKRDANLPLLLLFLGSTIGNLERSDLPEFFAALRSYLRPGDFLLIGADLEKDVSAMLAAYDDPTGVTAAFNLNLLGRINRELQGNFNLRAFKHEAKWNPAARRIEMHLLSFVNQVVHVAGTGHSYAFSAGETIWTEASHKFSLEELQTIGLASRFVPVSAWTDAEWPFAELLWQAA